MKKDENEEEKSPFEKFIKGVLLFFAGLAVAFFPQVLFEILSQIAVWMYENSIEYMYWLFVAALVGVIFYVLMKRKKF